jgi:HAUS augmin-like complex subunit 1
MAHLQKQAAIFSPSVARAAASAAKDWNAVDSWLASRLGRAPPPFERNAETLRVLLALVSANESADEERDVLCRAEADALAEINNKAAEEEEDVRGDGDGDLDSVKDDILSMIESSLPRDGRQALDALASSAGELGLSPAAAAEVDAASIGQRLASLQAEIFTLSQAADRVSVLRRYIDLECVRMEAVVRELCDGESYRPPADLAKQNLEIQRRLKTAAAALPRTTRKVDGVPEGGLTAEQVRAEEEEFLALLVRRNDLDAQVRSFQGLPPDPDAARHELERLRDELRQATRRRDTVFEGLVERETPRKPER